MNNLTTKVKSELDCRIYVDSASLHSQIFHDIASLVSGTVNMFTIHTDGWKIDVIENDEFDIERRQKFPDGFLWFRYYIEFYPTIIQSSETRIVMVTKVLKGLWAKGIPAIASCDYERNLPNAGGYKSHAVPWVRDIS